MRRAGLAEQHAKAKQPHEAAAAAVEEGADHSQVQSAQKK
jgi:hypothetical protein